MQSTFGTRLLALRQARGITRRDLAARVQLSENYLEKLERGYNAPPSAATLQVLARVLGAGDELFLLAGKLPPDLDKRLCRDALLLQVLRVASTCDGATLHGFLRSLGVAEEELAPASTCSFEVEDERRVVREPITAEMKRAVFKADGFECVYCSAQSVLEVDHVHPHSLGGTNEMENLVTACNRCNGRKKAKVAPFPMVFGRFRAEVENG